MEVETSERWRELAQVAETGSPAEIEQFLEQLPEGDVAIALSRLTDEQQAQVFAKLEPDQGAELVEHLSDAQAIGLIENMSPESAASILDLLPSNDQADLIAELDEEDAEAILEQMDPEEATDARSLSQYEDDVAGGLMVTELLRYSEEATVGDVIEDMRERADEYRDYDVQYAYVCDNADHLKGVLRLRDLLLAKRSRQLAEIVIRNPKSVLDQTSLDDLADFFDHHSYLGLPVTNEEGRLLGVVQKAAVDEAWADRQDSDYMKTQGIVGEELRNMPLTRRATRRLSWLSVNIVLNIMAASIIALFQDTLSAVIALAVFLPIISDMSGCSGNQAVAVSMRELSLGLIRPQELLRVWMKEITVGMFNGAALGILIGSVAWLWQGNIYLGLVVGLALCMNTMVAVSIGGIVPLVLKRFQIDPAIASGPLLTTVTDMCGFFFVLGIATMFLPLLV